MVPITVSHHLNTKVTSKFKIMGSFFLPIFGRDQTMHNILSDFPYNTVDG